MKSAVQKVKSGLIVGAQFVFTEGTWFLECRILFSSTHCNDFATKVRFKTMFVFDERFSFSMLGPMLGPMLGWKPRRRETIVEPLPYRTTQFLAKTGVTVWCDSFFFCDHEVSFGG